MVLEGLHKELLKGLYLESQEGLHQEQRLQMDLPSNSSHEGLSAVPPRPTCPLERRTFLHMSPTPF